MIRQPPNVPQIEPTPPEMAVPPRITPEILSNARSEPALGSPEFINAASIRPEIKAVQPAHRVSCYLDQPDIYTSYSRCFRVAPDASHIESKFCLCEEKPGNQKIRTTEIITGDGIIPKSRPLPNRSAKYGITIGTGLPDVSVRANLYRYSL